MTEKSQTSSETLGERIKNRVPMTLEDTREEIVMRCYFGERVCENTLLNALHYLGTPYDK